MFNRNGFWPGFAKKAILVIGALLLVSCNSARPSDSQAGNPGGNGGVRVAFEASYEALSLDDRIRRADAIFVGTVKAISVTSWNQDSGEYWEENVVHQNGLETTYPATPVYQLDLAITKSIVDRIGLDDSTTLTIIGVSPMEQQVTVQTIEYGQVSYFSPHSTTLQVGEEVVVFATWNENLAWRDGVRSVLYPLGAPDESYLTLGADGLYHSANPAEEPLSLEALVARIAQQRPTDGLSTILE